MIMSPQNQFKKKGENKSKEEPIFKGIRAAFLDESLEEMQFYFRELGGRVLNLDKGNLLNYLNLYLVDKENYKSALRWCDYIILDEESNLRMNERQLKKVAKRLSAPQDELLELL
jgi:hypothetical protein